ncbi:MAG: flagellar biosynthesis protein FlhF [Burkholderiales bacterium]|nr:flagellar biosynthesis protein FlhF [Burkholderiales bacterium]
MVVRKFFATSTREALRLVREALGNEALILSNRPVAGGVEIMAVAEHEVASVAVSAPPAAPKPQQPQTPAQPVPPSAFPRNDGVAGLPAARDAVTTQDLVNEVRLLRGLVEGQLAGFAWKDLTRRSPTQAELIRELMGRGFGASFARALATRLPTDHDRSRARRWVKAVLTSSLRCVMAGEDLVTRGGVYALVGPTGVGKTTTVAKLAASCTLQHGPAQVALVTTDSYRIGAVDQLRIYGKILGVPVFSVKDGQDLAVTLAELRGRHLVLVDTVGMGQRDRRVAEQIALLSGTGRPLQRLLLLSAVAQGEALEDTLQRYRGDGLAGCVLTKVDEALSLGGALDVVVRSKLPLHYVTNGQRVPEDLHLASALYLVERAFRGDAIPAAFRRGPEEVPLAFAAGMGG